MDIIMRLEQMKMPIEMCNHIYSFIGIHPIAKQFKKELNKEEDITNILSTYSRKQKVKMLMYFEMKKARRHGCDNCCNGRDSYVIGKDYYLCSSCLIGIHDIGELNEAMNYRKQLDKKTSKRIYKYVLRK